MTTYSQFQQQNSSEKVVLVTMNAKKRLMAWSVYSGSVYKLESQAFDYLEKIEDSGTAYTEVASIGAITAGKWYYDRSNTTIYLRASDSSNPNSRFLVATIRYFFSNVGARASYDLSTGYDVYWRPLLLSSSDFGAELDNQDQIGFAIEGSGSVTFANDQSFWTSIFDQLSWENQTVKVYSWSKQLAITEAKLIFWGKINGKSWDLSRVSFKLKDLLLELRNPVALNNIEDLSGELVPDSLNKAKQRLIYGIVEGLRPVNIDQVLPDVGYQLTGTISVSATSAAVTGSGTSFFNDISPDDKLLISGVEYTVESITDDTHLTLTEDYAAATASGLDLYIYPDQSKDYTNRIWNVAGHQINEPQTTVSGGISQNRIELADATDFFEGDDIYVGTLGAGEVVKINQVLGGSIVTLTTNLATVPSAGTAVRRPGVQDVRTNNTKLVYYRDYTFDAATAKITLDTDAEFNASAIRTLGTNLTWANSSRTVTGAGLTKSLRPGMYIAKKSEQVWYQISSIEDETSLTLQTLYAGGTGAAQSQYKSIPPFTEGDDVLTCKVYGKTDDSTSTGVLLRTGPEIVKDILTEIGLSSQLNTASFTSASASAPHILGITIPSNFSDTSAPSVRDIIQKINQSIFGSIIENADFELEYQILQPQRPTAITILRELDILNFKVDTGMDRIVKQVNVLWGESEYDYVSKDELTYIYEKTSDVGAYLTESIAEKEIETYLITEDDARVFASRWLFLLEYGSSVINISTKMQAARLRVTDKVEMLHEKLYDRIGGGQQKVAAINSIKQDGANVDIELEDLGNAFTRVCIIAPATSDTWANLTASERWQNGFITDDYGLISNDGSTFGLNLLW